MRRSGSFSLPTGIIIVLRNELVGPFCLNMVVGVTPPFGITLANSRRIDSVIVWNEIHNSRWRRALVMVAYPLAAEKAEMPVARVVD
jgi:hypothetical protein